MSLFHDSLRKDTSEVLVRQWKNSSRHYGPESEVTLMLLDKIKDSLKGRESEDILRIRSNLEKIAKNIDDF